MTELSKTNSGGLISLLHNNDDGLDIPKPFERDIFLFDSQIAGTSHVEGIMELEPFLVIGDKLNFYREPDNPYDPKAILVKNENGIKLGYVPKNDNAVFSRLMDAGKLLFGQIESKQLVGDWLKIDIKIFLHE